MNVKVACALTVVVVLAHFLILQGTSNALRAGGLNASRPFTTRSISLNSVQPAAQVAPPAPSSLAPQPTKVQVKPANPPRPRKTPPTINTDATTIGPVAVAQPEGPAGRGGEPAEPPPVGFGNVASEPPPSPPTTSPAAGAGAVANPQPTPAPTPSPPPPATTAYTVPGSTRLKYNVIATKDSLSFNARGELLWLQDGNTYDARLEISAFLLGARVQTSTGRLTAAGLEPKRFSDKFRSEVAVHFERDKGVVTFSANTPQVPLVAGMQDQLSAVMQLSAMIAAAPAQYPPGTAIQFDTVGPRSSEQWVLTVGEEEKLSLPGGELQALKLYRKPRGEYDQTLEVWLAPRLNYLPARIKLTEKNGDYADQVWRATEAP
jgi:hypothetical protein